LEQLTTLYVIPSYSITMKANQSQQIDNWDRMVHAPFKKVVKFDLFCMGLGVIMGMGIGAFLVAGA